MKNKNLFLIFLLLLTLTFCSCADANATIISNDVEVNTLENEEIIEIEVESIPITEEVELPMDYMPRLLSGEFGFGGISQTAEHKYKYVCLTFDDGPSKKTTEKIVNLLKEYGAVATFFEIGYLVDDYPELIKMEVDAGCEVGSHTYNHINLKNNSYSTCMNEINKSVEAIYNATGSYPTLIRPPYGSVNSDVLSDLDMSGILWSIDTRDWQSRNKDKIMKVIYDEGDLSGQVILMHSVYESTYEALKELLPYLHDNGYKTVTVSQLINEVYGEELENGRLYKYSYFLKHKTK